MPTLTFERWFRTLGPENREHDELSTCPYPQIPAGPGLLRYHKAMPETLPRIFWTLTPGDHADLLRNRRTRRPASEIPTRCPGKPPDTRIVSLSSSCQRMSPMDIRDVRDRDGPGFTTRGSCTAVQDPRRPWITPTSSPSDLERARHSSSKRRAGDTQGPPLGHCPKLLVSEHSSSRNTSISAFSGIKKNHLAGNRPGEARKLHAAIVHSHGAGGVNPRSGTVTGVQHERGRLGLDP